jgi:hypothetical protein
MPFGLFNKAQTFQCLMDNLFSAMDFVFIFVDDTLIARVSFEQYLVYLELSFAYVAELVLIINPAKCQFLYLSLVFYATTCCQLA